MKAEWKGLNEWIQAENKYEKDVVSKVFDEVATTAIKVERDSKNLSPVDTGKLRGSITTDTKRSSTSITSEIGTDVEYSEIVEYGAINQRAQPYLIPSFDRNTAKLENTIKNILGGS